MYRILILGSSGYLGNELKNFLTKKHDIFSINRKNDDITSNSFIEKNSYFYEFNEELNNLYKNIKPQIVINSIAKYESKENNKDIVYANNVLPKLHFDLSVKHNAKFFINIGTSLPENLSLYAKTKNQFVKYAKAIVQKNTIFVNLKVEHFYGENQTERFISDLIKKCKKNLELNLTDGLQKRDFIYIKDLLSAIDLIINNLNNVKGNIDIPIGSGQSYCIRDIVNIVHKLTGSNSRIIFGAIKKRKNEPDELVSNNAYLNSLGWNAKTSLEEGLKRVI